MMISMDDLQKFRMAKSAQTLAPLEILSALPRPYRPILWAVKSCRVSIHDLNRS
jgi:hypothetical protein